jgi:hypothetical protein
MAEERRQGDAEGLEHDAGAARSGVAQDVALAVLLDLGHVETFEVLHHIGPLEVVTGGGEAILDFLGSLRADSDEVARAFRDDVARDYEMMSPGYGASLTWVVLGIGGVRIKGGLGGVQSRP